MSNNKLLSIILLSYYSEERIKIAYDKIKLLLDEEEIPFELIVMDDGSKDNSYKIALGLEKRYDNVRAYQLSRNYTSFYSAFAGVSICKGGCATLIPDDEQQPYSTLVEAYRLWEQGHKIIIPNRISREDSINKYFFSNLYYKIMNSFSVIQYPVGGCDTFFIDREIIDILNTRIHPINTCIITEILRLGFDTYFLPFERPLGLNGHGSRWSWKGKVKLAKDMFFSSSSFPIKLIMNMGLWISALSIIGIFFYLYIGIFGNWQFWGINVRGWLSIVLLIMFFGGVILFSLGIIAEYIWRIYEEVKDRPGYIIKQKQDNN